MLPALRYVIVALLAMLPELQGSSFMDTQATLAHFRNSASSASQQFKTVSARAKTFKDRASEYAGHAHGIAGKAKSAACSTFGVMCQDVGRMAKCVGDSCCPRSSCRSNHVPGTKCDSDRGLTTCIGGSIFKAGQCACQFGSCNAAGRCPNAPPDFTRLFEEKDENTVVPQEDFTGPMMFLLGIIGFTSTLVFVAVGRRVRRALNQFEYKEMLIKTEDAAVLE